MQRTKMAAPKKRRQSPRSVQTVHIAHADQVSWSKLTAEHLGKMFGPIKTLAGYVTAIGIILVAGTAVWKYFDWPWLVNTHELNTTIGKVETKIGGQIVSTKTEVLDTTGKQTDEVKKDVGEVKKSLDAFARKNESSYLQMLEGQTRQLFRDKTQMSAQLGAIEVALREKPGDQFLLQRKAEIEAFLTFTDRESARVQDQLAAARRGDPAPR